MHLALADAARGEADRDILHRAAEAAHRVTLEMGENDEGVVIHDMAAHRHMVEMEAVTDREVNAAFLVKNVDRAEIPAIHLQRFTVTFRRVAVTFVKGVRLNDVAVRDAALEVTHEVTRKNIGTVLFTGVQLDRGAAVDAFIHAAIELKEVLGVDHRRKEHFRAGTRDIKTRDVLRPDHRSLRIGCCHLKISNETGAIPVFSEILVICVQRHFLIINFRRQPSGRCLSFSQKLAGNKKAGSRMNRPGSRSLLVGDSYPCVDYSTATITEEALITAKALTPTSRPRDSAEAVVMEETIFSPAAVSRVTSVETGPFLMETTLPSRQLRAEIFIVFLILIGVFKG